VNGGELDLNKTAGIAAIGTGGVTVAGGTLKNLQAEQIADTATVTATSGVWDLGSFAETVGALAGTTSAVVTGAAGAILTVNIVSSAVYGGVISGGLAITKKGNGTQTLSGNNS